MNRDVLLQQLDTYIRVRKALGAQMRDEPKWLRDFIDFLEIHGEPGPIRAQLALDWASGAGSPRGRSATARRLSMARRFLIYLRATWPATEVPGRHLVASVSRPTPYIFTPEQINTLIQAAQNIGPRGSLRPDTFSTLIGLLASTGLRGAEACRLTMADLYLETAPAYVHIRESKFRKSRLVPLHDTIVEPLRRYIAMRAVLHDEGATDVLFVSRSGQAFLPFRISRWFTKLCQQLGIEAAKGKRRPSLHGLRHFFAVQRIRLWYQQGADVRALMPSLSVYLGHANPRYTYWYLTATPDLLEVAADRFLDYVITDQRR